MRNANAILNLSEYEGWSSCIEEAISFNVPLVLNSIPIHLEQIPNAYFIDINNPNWQFSLKNLLNQITIPKYDYQSRINRSNKLLSIILNKLK